ncbi:hypothetical protein IGK74_000412 [Enterococcus sp. AZ150]|uniref:Panacea domain-containing protein n=1 Tax=Enterococcus sp. AZ150 TaxID=2774866 RepID=UPI003F29B389
MYDVLDIANYLIFKANNDGKRINNLKLQKILYYIYSFNLRDKIFDSSPEKWRLGPVFPEVYHTFKNYGSNDILEVSDKIDFEKFEVISFEKQILKQILERQDIASKIDNIYCRLIDLDVFDIVDKTHEEEMWLSMRERINNGEKHLIYSDEELNNFFDNKNINDYFEVVHE